MHARTPCVCSSVTIGSVNVLQYAILAMHYVRRTGSERARMLHASVDGEMLKHSTRS